MIRKPSLTLRHLAFTGPGLSAASLGFDPGLNIVYGASNTGKSFTAEAIDFMLGGSQPLPATAERAGYDAVWLGLQLADGGERTLYRAAQGGPFELVDGLVTHRPGADVRRTLKEKHDARSRETVSNFLLEAIGLGGKEIVKNATGQKNTLTFRYVAPLVIVEEDDIFAKRSPILSGQRQDTIEKNAFRVMLTGRDDASVVPAVGTKELKTFNAGKMELVEQLLADADRELGEAGADRAGLEERAGKVAAVLARFAAVLEARQERLDALSAERRSTLVAADEAEARAAELAVTVARFRRLDTVYASDFDRLEALEENSFLLKTVRGRECPTCGAPPEDHRHGPTAEQIGLLHTAALAEMRKIERNRRDLEQVILSLEAEASAVRKGAATQSARAASLGEEIRRIRPLEASARRHYELLASELDRVRRLQDLFARRDRLVVEQSRLLSKEANRAPKQNLTVGVDQATAFRFTRVIEDVLGQWRFPGAPRVSWDDRKQDILLDGKERSANGKGVRAILHAAFKVAVMLYCHENELPHPGFVVLDTPLLTYREPMRSKHGPLSDDERALRATPLDERFYDHLASIRDIGQVVVLENADPPASALDLARTTVFTSQVDATTRFGFFPVGSERPDA